MMRNLYSTFVLCVLCVAIFTACRNKTEDDTIPSDGTVVESNDAQSQWDNLLKISEDALDQKGELAATTKIATTKVFGCAQSVVQETISEGNFIGQITIDFGTSYTNVCFDGKTRRGQLIVKYTGRYRDPNTVVQITTNNYHVNNAKVEGRRTVTNMGNFVYNVVDSGLDGTGYATTTTIDGKVSTWRATRTRTWTEGTSTPSDFSDDVYLINGSGDGKSSAGDVFTTTATNIKIRFFCYAAYMYMPVSGILEIQSPLGKRFIDYGLGTCDRTALFTSVKGKTYTLTL